MRIAVDTARCEGFGFCEQAAPTLIALDDDGYAVVTVDVVDEADIAKAETAIRSCPVAALKSLE